MNKLKVKNNSFFFLDQPIFTISKKQQLGNIKWIEVQL